MRLNAKRIASYTGGQFVVEPQANRAISTGLNWDSRQIVEGDCYVALPGERVDGHDFIPQALRAGANCILASLPLKDEVLDLAKETGAAVIEVADGAAAITDLAREWRKELKGRVIGLTGSAGKTTTKNLVRDVLASAFDVVATKANQNNELGVPYTLLRANPETEAVVVEMGMRGLGQIRELAEFARPDWGIITIISSCHMELLGSQENIALAKAELFDALPSSTGIAFVNATDSWQDFACKHAQLADRGVEMVRYDSTGAVSQSRGPAVWAEDVQIDAQGCPHFTLCQRCICGDDPEKIHVDLVLRGEHNVGNALAAAAVGLSMGMTLQQVADALGKAEPEKGRQEVHVNAAGVTLINDAYNANPDSMRAALNMITSMDVAGRRVAVLGDMAELGDVAVESHQGVGRLVAERPIDLLVCVGELARHIGAAAAEAGYDASSIVYADAVDQVLDNLKTYLGQGDCVLVKASNFMGLGRIVEGLMI